jgi:osmotically-inducible protein OsmY
VKQRKRISAVLLITIVALLAGCAPLSNDPSTRTAGRVFDDIAVQTLALHHIRRADPGFRRANLTIASHNGHVLLAGQVRSDALRAKAEDVVRALDPVKSVHNELTVSGTSGMLTRTNDRWLTSKVNAKLIADRDVSADRILVVSENGVVYLMGIVTRKQADEAVRVTSSVGGVQRIVKVFEYLD